MVKTAPTQPMLEQLGPLAQFVGEWEGFKGTERDQDRTQLIKNNFRDHIILEPTGAFTYHDKSIYGLRFQLRSYRPAAKESFHEELGFWMWEPEVQQIHRLSVDPRGFALIASGTVKEGAKNFTLKAHVESRTSGLLVDHFFESGGTLKKYELHVQMNPEGSWVYVQSSWLEIPGQSELHLHVEENTLSYVSG